MILRQHRGATMISLLVGMVVSMLAILASLSMFHDLVRTSAEAKTDARHEGDLSLAVLRLDQELLSAGFDMGRAPTDDKNLDFLVLPENAVAVGTSQVAWRLKNAAQYICKRARSRREGDRYILELTEISDGLCTRDWPLNAANVNNPANWPAPAEQIASIQLLSLDGAIAFTSPLINFVAAADSSCAPYGAAAPVVAPAVAPRHPMLTLNVFDPAAVYTPPDPKMPPPAPRAHSVCLVNIVVPVVP